MTTREGPLRFDVLPPRQHAVLRRIAPVATAERFYLAGGTAIALHFGHRQSVDFDWFRNDPIDNPALLARLFETRGIPLAIQSVSRDTLHGRVDRVNVSFFSYPYPLLRPGRACLEPHPFVLASLEDLAAMKLAAVAQRGSRKDLVDVVALGRTAIPLGDMLAAYRRKYRVRDVGHLLVALTYFDDADREPALRGWKGADWDETKSVLRGWVKTIAGKVR